MQNDSVSVPIVLNGQQYTVASGSSLFDLINALDGQGKRFAIELNGDIVPRTRFIETILSPMDRVEIVHAIGGG